MRMYVKTTVLICLFVTSLLFVQSEAHAAVGDIGIWRDSAGAQLPGTSFAAMNFATQERNDGVYTFTGSNNLNLDEAGNYLLIGTLKLDDASNGRVNYEGRFTYTGTGDFISINGTGYSRNSANRVSWVRVVGLVWGAAANDDVQLEIRRDTDAPTGGSIADASHFQVVRLHDSAAVGIYTDTSDAASYESQTWTDAPFNNNVLQNDTGVIEKQAGNSDIRLKQDATTFLVGYGLAFDMGDANRTQRTTKMVAGTSDIENSFSYTYMRTTSDQYGAPNGLFLYRNSGTSTDLSVQAQRGNAELVSSTGSTRRTSTSGVFVVELPSSAETLISHDSTGAQDIGGTSGDFNAIGSGGLYNDASSFTRVNDTTVNAEQAMDALLMGQAAAERSGTSGTRMTAGCRFEIQGADRTVGEQGWYLRGNESGGARNYTYNYACFPSGVYSVSSGDDIQFEWFDGGDNGSTDNTTADAVGFSALNLDTLEVAAPTYTQNDFEWFVTADSVTLSNAWPPGGGEDLAENAALTQIPSSNETLESGDQIRVQMNFTVSTATLAATTQAFKLQYDAAEDCTAASGWTDVGAKASGSIWRLFDEASIGDSTEQVNNISTSTASAEGYYSEINASGTNPNEVLVTENSEWDWPVENNGATDNTTYCFRMVLSDDTAFDTYNSDSYPKLTTAPGPGDLLRHGNVFQNDTEQGFFW